MKRLPCIIIIIFARMMEESSCQTFHCDHYLCQSNRSLRNQIFFFIAMGQWKDPITHSCMYRTAFNSTDCRSFGTGPVHQVHWFSKVGYLVSYIQSLDFGEYLCNSDAQTTQGQDSADWKVGYLDSQKVYSHSIHDPEAECKQHLGMMVTRRRYRD